MPVGQEVTATMRKGRPGPPESSPVLPGAASAEAAAETAPVSAVSSVVSSTTSSVLSSVLSSPVSAAGVGSSRG